MLQKYKIPLILFVTFLVLLVTYYNSTSRHWIYYKMVNMFVPKKIENTIADSSLLYKNYIILDARSYKEYAVSHLKNAIWIGDDTLAIERANFETGKSEPRYIIYCSIGYRSQLIGMQLKDSLGFSVKNIEGGIFGWNQKRLPIVDSKNNRTSAIHPYSLFWSFWTD